MATNLDTFFRQRIESSQRKDQLPTLLNLEFFAIFGTLCVNRKECERRIAIKLTPTFYKIDLNEEVIIGLQGFVMDMFNQFAVSIRRFFARLLISLFLVFSFSHAELYLLLKLLELDEGKKAKSWIKHLV